MVTLEPAGPSMILGFGCLLMAQAGAPNEFTSAVLQGGAMVLLAGVLWVIFKEIVPRQLNEVREIQEARRQDQVNFMKALSDQQAAHMTEMERARRSHEEVLKSISESRGCNYTPGKR